MLCAVACRRRTQVVDVGVLSRGRQFPNSELDQDRNWLVTRWQGSPRWFTDHPKALPTDGTPWIIQTGVLLSLAVPSEPLIRIYRAAGSRDGRL